MRRYYEFAGIGLAVRIPPERMYRNALQLAAFETEQVTAPHCYTVSVGGEPRLPAGEPLASLPGCVVYGLADGYLRCYGDVQRGAEGIHTWVEHRGKEHRIMLRERFVPGVVSARLVLNALDVEHLVCGAGGVILHASYIEWEGRAIVFTAPSGTGKSTQAELWKRHRGAQIINGDRAVLMPRQGAVFAAGLPFSGSSRYCLNRTLPLAAVVYLKQAPETKIHRLGGVEAFRRVWEGCCVNAWNRADVAGAAAAAEAVLGSVPVYELACTPDVSAVEALEQELRKQA